MSEATATPAEPGTAIALLDNRVLVAADVFRPGASRIILDEIKRKVAETPQDASTEKGRKDIRSLRFTIARSKTTLDKMGLELTEGLRASVDAVNAERKAIKTELEALEDQVMVEVTAWEARDGARIQIHQDLLLQLRDLANVFPAAGNTDAVIEDITQRAARALEIANGRDWQEFRVRASDMLAKVTDALEAALVIARKTKADKEQREAERLAKAEADRIEALRVQAAREAEIARAAREQAEKQAVAAKAAQARAEEHAEFARVTEHGNVIRQIMKAGEIEGQTSEQIGLRLALATEVYQGRDWQEFADTARKAMQMTGDALNKARTAALAREDEVKEDYAREAERQRVQMQQDADAKAKRDLDAATAAAQAEANKRAENVAHRRAINREALAKVVAIIDEHDRDGSMAQVEFVAEKIVEAIARGEIPHVFIKY